MFGLTRSQPPHQQMQIDPSAQQEAEHAFFEAVANDDHHRALELASDIDVTCRGDNRSQPLHTASQKGWKDVAQVLLSRGASLETENNDDKTPFDIALGVCKDHPEVLELFITYLKERGAFTDFLKVTDIHHRTKMHAVVLAGKEACERALQHIPLADLPELLFLEDRLKQTPFDLAAFLQCQVRIQLLLRAADPFKLLSHTDNSKKTPLHLAFCNRFVWAATREMLNSTDRWIELLTMPDSQGSTPLMLALNTPEAQEILKWVSEKIGINPDKISFEDVQRMLHAANQKCVGFVNICIVAFLTALLQEGTILDSFAKSKDHLDSIELLFRILDQKYHILLLQMNHASALHAVIATDQEKKLKAMLKWIENKKDLFFLLTGSASYESYKIAKRVQAHEQARAMTPLDACRGSKALLAVLQDIFAGTPYQEAFL